MGKLTKRQKQVLEAFQDRKNWNPPTIRDVAKLLGISFPAVDGHIRAIEKKGFTINRRRK